MNTEPALDPLYTAVSAGSRYAETLCAHRQERTPYERFEDAWTGFQPSSDETIARLTSANVEASYRQTIDGPFAFAIVGAITPAALEPVLAQWVATLPAPSSGAAVAAPPPAAEATDLTLHSGIPERAELGLRWEIASWHSSDQNTTLDAAIRLLSDRLRPNLPDLGDGEVWADGGPHGELAISVRQTCRPEQVVELEEAIRAQVAAFADTPPTSHAVAALRSPGRTPYNSRTLTDRLAEALLDDRPLAEGLVPPAPTPADIHALAHRVLTEGVLTRVVMTP